MDIVEGSLGDRMKMHERRTGSVLEKGSYCILRIDGRAFHSYTRGLERPFDNDLVSSMNKTAEKVCSEISGSFLSYTQSDEISVLFSDLASDATELWFGGKVQKIVSVAAAIATGEFVSERGSDRSPVFDARVFTLPDEYEVANYFRWRQRDCSVNAVSMMASCYFSKRDLHGKSTADRLSMMRNTPSIPDIPRVFRLGRLTIKSYYKSVSTWKDKEDGEVISHPTIRSRWDTITAPDLEDKYDAFVQEIRNINKRGNGNDRS